MWNPFRSTPRYEVVRLSENIAEVPALDLMGPFATSPDGRFTLVWSDADPSGRRGGYRESGHGRYALIEGLALRAQGTMERPNDGHVARNGTFVLTDWMFGDALRSEFHVISSNGEPLLRERFTANGFSSGIAPDGSRVAYQLCNSDTPDGGMLVVFDVRTRVRLAAFTPRAGWGQEYIFAPDRIGVVNGEQGTFWYDFDGVLLNPEAWVQHRDDSPNGFRMLEHAQASLESAPRPLSEADAKSILETAAAAGEQLERWPRYAAKAERLRGEVAEERGDASAAIQHFQRALQLDPRCGVKKRLAALQLRPQSIGK